MLILNPDGYCRGDRTAECERMSWLYFPSIFLCANGYGRFEVNHGRIAHQIGVHAPTEAEFEACIQEYARVHLLFLYRVGVKRWGQWDADKRFLPRWKTAEDKRSPFPPEPDYTNWLKEYHGSESKGLPKDSEDSGGFLGNSDSSCRSSCRSSRVVEVGVDVKTPCASADARRSVLSPSIEPPLGTAEPDALFPVEPSKPEKSIDGLTDQQEVWFAEWFEVFWTRKGKKKARQLFARKVKTVALFQKVMAATKQQAPAEFGKDAQYRCHPSTYLSQERWEDEASGPAPKEPVRLLA